ncbi:Metallo-dependent phosphatase-like protein [Naviculisporaceae sp. PSN 640]
MAQIPTTFLIISDTHAESMPDLASLPPVDVAIHCGDLTEESKLSEFSTTLDLLKSIKAEYKLVIAGNHEWTLDESLYRARNQGMGMGSAANHGTATSSSGISLSEIHRTYGYPGQANDLLKTARSEGIIFLREEGTYDFRLANNAWLTVYASPYTPSSASSDPSLPPMGAFQYHRSHDHGHAFNGMTRAQNIDVVITHGPPCGILDRTEDKIRLGCPLLFEAVERARPRMHCFGHVHEGWGAKMVTWRDSDRKTGERVSHFTAIDNGNSQLIESLGTLKPGKWDSPEVVEEKRKKLEGYRGQGYYGTVHRADIEEGEVITPLEKGKQTLFVNAAIQGLDREEGQHFPWIVTIHLNEAPPLDYDEDEDMGDWRV